MKKPLSVAAGVIFDNDKVLLIKRSKEPYKDLLTFPGGKIEPEEFICEAAIREIKEETGLPATFIAHRGILSEVLEDKHTNEKATYLVHMCELKAEHTNLIPSEEGELLWLSLEQAKQRKNEFVPSDFHMIELAFKKKSFYATCRIKKEEGQYVLEHWSTQ